jgi:hypothetical protein
VIDEVNELRENDVLYISQGEGFLPRNDSMIGAQAGTSVYEQA